MTTSRPHRTPLSLLIVGWDTFSVNTAHTMQHSGSSLSITLVLIKRKFSIEKDYDMKDARKVSIKATHLVPKRRAAAYIVLNVAKLNSIVSEAELF